MPGDREEVWQSGQNKSKHEIKINTEKCSERKGTRISFYNLCSKKKKEVVKMMEFLREHGNFTGGLFARLI